MLPAVALTLLLTPAHDGVPAFDLAMQADLVVVAAVIRQPKLRPHFRIIETLGGTPPSALLPIANTSRLGLHYHAAKSSRPHLMFLHRVHDGWMVTQHPGVQRPWTDANAGPLRDLLSRLRALRQPGAATTLSALVRYARDAAGAHADLAAAALLALSRRPDLALRADVATRSELSTILNDERLDLRMRDHAARCLTGSREPGFASTLLAMLARGRAKGLGDTFGALLQHLRGADALAQLKSLMHRGWPGAHTEIVRAAAATHTKEARTWLAGHAAHPQRGDAVRRALGLR